MLGVYTHTRSSLRNVQKVYTLSQCVQGGSRGQTTYGVKSTRATPHLQYLGSVCTEAGPGTRAMPSETTLQKTVHRSFRCHDVVETQSTSQHEAATAAAPQPSAPSSGEAGSWSLGVKRPVVGSKCAAQLSRAGRRTHVCLWCLKQQQPEGTRGWDNQD